MKKLILLSAFILTLVSCSAPVETVVAPAVDTIVAVVAPETVVTSAVVAAPVVAEPTVVGSTGTTGTVKK